MSISLGFGIVCTVDMTGELVVGIHFPDIRIVLYIYRGGKISDDF